MTFSMIKAPQNALRRFCRQSPDAFPASCQTAVKTVYDRNHCKNVRRQIGQTYRRSFVKRIFRCGTVSRECFRRERILISEDTPAKPGKTVHQDFFILKERQSVH